jgi:hypothetical protein
MSSKFTWIGIMAVVGCFFLLAVSQAQPGSMVVKHHSTRGNCLLATDPPGVCGDGSKVVGRVVAIDSSSHALMLEVHHLPFNSSEPERVDTLTIRVTSRTVLMRDGKSVPLEDLSVLSAGATIGVMGGPDKEGRIVARCLGEDCARMARVIPPHR